jgi:Spy/CpxP family protein refolding chaperone
MKIAVFAFALLAAFAALVLSTTPAYCQDKAASFTDDMEKLTTAVKLTDEQKKKIETMKTARDAAVEKWSTTNQKKTEAAEKAVSEAKDDKKRAAAEKSLKATMAGRDKIYADADKAMFALLTKEQKGTWNGGILNDAATADLSGIEPALTDAQTKKIAEICKTKGEAMASPIDAASMTAGLAAFMAPIVKQVLLPAQQKEYAKSHKPEPKPKAGAAGGAGL